MGGSISTAANIVDDTFESISKSTIRSIQQCENPANIDQVITIGGNTDVEGVYQDAVIVIEGTCKQEAGSISEIVANVKRDMAQKTKDEKDAAGEFFNKLAPGKTNTHVFQSVKLANRIEEMLTQETINKVIANVTANQKIEIAGKGSRKGIHQSVAAKLSSNVLQTTTAGRKLTADISETFKQSQDAKSTGLFSSGAFTVIAIGAAVVGAFYIYANFIRPSGGGGGGGGISYVPMPPQYEQYERTRRRRPIVRSIPSVPAPVPVPVAISPVA